jgi:stage II sporulation protein E
MKRRLPKGFLILLTKAENKAENKAEKEAASTLSDTAANKTTKKTKHLNIFSDQAKEKIKEYLLWQNINVKFLEVIPSNKASILLSMTVRTEKTPDEAETAIALIVRNLTGAKLRCVERVVIAPNYYVFKFKNLKKIKIRTYTATAVKDGSLVSGDNFAYAGRADKYYVVLCDGIGSGEEAHSESNSALDLMSRFLYSDFTEEQILRTLNSVLMIALGDDRYVTFDFTVIDYGTKEMRLYKAGAAPSYILSNKGVEKITGKSLPLGILDNFEYSSFKKQINIGDMLVMVSDGIIDSINLDPKKSLDKYLESLTKKDPQTAANSILSYALRGQDKIIDDMTVLVTKIG